MKTVPMERVRTWLEEGRLVTVLDVRPAELNGPFLAASILMPMRPLKRMIPRHCLRSIFPLIARWWLCVQRGKQVRLQQSNLPLADSRCGRSKEG